MDMEHWWNDTYKKNSLSQCRTFPLYISHGLIRD